jgi:oligopeptide transport system substrate-binding protein
VRTVALILVGAALAVACPPQTPERSPTPGPPITGAPSDGEAGGTLTTFLRQPTTIDPALAVDAWDLQVVSQIFDALTTSDAQLRIVPAAAQRWEVSADGLVYTFHLRPDATFHDGSPVDADSFVRGWRRVADASRPTPSAAHFLLERIVGFAEAQQGQAFSGLVVVDPLTLQVTLDTPIADFPAIVSHPGLAPVPTSAVDDTEAFQAEPVGNGPFRMSEPWQRDRFVRLEAWPGYWGRGAMLDEVVFRIYTGEDAIETGYADFGDTLDVAEVPAGQLRAAVDEFGAAGDRRPGVIDGVKLITAFYGFNTRKPPFDDPTVRQALSLLIDRDAIADQILDGERVAATSVVPPGTPGYTPVDCGFCAYDPARAQQLIAGRQIGPIELYYSEDLAHDPVAQRVKRDVDAALGPDTLVLKPLPQRDWLQAIRLGEAGMFLSGWLAEYPAADAYLHPLFSRATLGQDNLFLYDSQPVDDLLGQARRELDATRRADLYRQAEAIVLTDMPVAPLFFYRHSRVVADHVHGYVMSPLGEVDLSRVSLDQQ